ncbi:phosphoribosylanthranilate isomerase [Gilvimarinus polysaccharolyticus]|uniref:phosphoribosylanthranilate isomerase n=1 Tax=Gilvimarinus polysaccharolyticus TaxID=863921 RepID=UPI0006731CCA|nr:phosphoribosylanthranilate isomerase [Gilvimarinus polysaccharolyticus]
MSSSRVKICGITRVVDVQHAVECGADAVGLVFYEPSKRAVSVAQAREIAYAAGPLVTITGLFVNAPAARVHQILREVPLQLLQFHGDETAEFCEQFERPYLKAIRMRPDLNLDTAMKPYANAVGLLLDAYQPGVPGGTGATFDWQRVPANPPSPVILAGGLTPANVAQAIAATGCCAVDVSGGVEASPGIKDPVKVAEFISNAKHLAPILAPCKK